MKVLQQLIKHFWHRGALTVDQAHYLVEHGFIRPHELDAYIPRPDESTDEECGTDFGESHSPLSLEMLPTDLEHQQEQLSGPPPGKRKRKGALPRVPDFSLDVLGQQLAGILKEREPWLAALVKLHGSQATATSAAGSAVQLRHLPPEAFRSTLLRQLRASPGQLAHLWECVDLEPFHGLLSQSPAHGRVARAFHSLLRADSPASWSSFPWILQVPEVQTVVNLLSIRRRLVPAIQWLYDKHKRTLDLALQRPSPPPRSWTGLGFGLVLVYNARAWRGKRTPAGFVLSRRPKPDGWREAWTAAMAIDSQRVMNYCIHVLGSLPGVGGSKVDFAMPEACQLICPTEWKI